MRAYLVTTGLLFGLLAALHVWRAVDEWPGANLGLFVVQMGALVALPGGLSWWAWRLWRKMR
jgi:hypothetical protein